ncbi:MAG TPA: HD domain-containing phosphohydrolase [Gemmatimonadales bacterium]|nr:HD domain-containing phosphohydrolase [Gemmatimonadales bacterium]
MTRTPSFRRREAAAINATYRTEVPPPVAGSPAVCLLADDDPDLRRSMVHVLEDMGLACIEAADGKEALAILDQVGELPLLVSDISMPRLDGLGLLREVRRRYPDMAVVMLSGVREAETAVECLLAGALDYITKPAFLGEIRSRIERAIEKRDLRIQNRFYQQNLERLVDQQAGRIKELFLEGVQTLVQALDAKDPYTRGHSTRVSEYATRIARRMGFTGDTLEDIRLGAQLHDIGKIGTREAVLRKPGPLTPEEFTHITEHTVLGERILSPLARDNPTVLAIVRSHHERVDGGGFPDHLDRDRIPWAARIVAVADAFDAMTTDRSYRTSLSAVGAAEELRACTGTHFDREVVLAFGAEFSDPARLLLGT